MVVRLTCACGFDEGAGEGDTPGNRPAAIILSISVFISFPFVRCRGIDFNVRASLAGGTSFSMDTSRSLPFCRFQCPCVARWGWFVFNETRSLAVQYSFSMGRFRSLLFGRFQCASIARCWGFVFNEPASLAAPMSFSMAPRRSLNSCRFQCALFARCYGVVFNGPPSLADY